VCDLEAIGAPSMFKLIRKVGVLTRMCPILDWSVRRKPSGENGRGGWMSDGELLKL
jgi:hypothetical protein